MITPHILISSYGEKLTYNGDNTVLLFSTNNVMSYGSVNTCVILVENSKIVLSSFYKSLSREEGPRGETSGKTSKITT